MKAAVYKRYGTSDVLSVQDVERPSIGDDEVLVRVYATSVTSADWRIRASAFPAYAWLPGRIMFGLFKPRHPVGGSEFAGRIVAKGKAVTRFRNGDSVFGFASRGAHAEYLTIGEDEAIATMPENLSYDEAAAVPFGALAALVFLRDFAKVERGQKVLVNGASGGVGVFAVQLAKHFGAEVTGVASTANLALLTSIGADHVVDHTVEDFTKADREYDLIIDTVGKTTFARSKRVLATEGIYLPIEFGLREIAQSLITAMTGGKRVKIGISGDGQDDLEVIADLLRRGELRPVIDGHYLLEDIADAHRRTESRHKTGSVVVNVAPAGTRDSVAA